MRAKDVDGRTPSDRKENRSMRDLVYTGFMSLDGVTLD
jgi:hypothetical protein